MNADRLLLADAETAVDLSTYLVRARRVDPDGAARLTAAGQVLAVYVSPLHGAGAPTVLGLRVLRLAEPADLDTTVPLGALTDRLARPVAAGPPVLPVPPMQARDAGWAGISPPRAGWQAVGTVAEGALLDAARAGIADVAAGAPATAAAPAIAQLRAAVWGRDLKEVDGLPCGAAFAAEALGFLGAGEPVALYASGAWRRLSTTRGHVLTRRSLL